MKIKFKSQPYQTMAVDAVVDCFAGQPRQDVLKYTIDPGADRQAKMEVDGFGNAPVKLPEDVLLENIRKVQRGAMLPPSDSLTHYTDDKGKKKPASYKPGAQINLDVEMETGTGKTYVYIKTMFEMHKRYGWSKFIIMVPSVAIREGVAKSIQMTAEHFQQEYGKKVRAFIYNSKRLHELESFSSDAGINVMVINVQAFNASGADNRRIYDELDDFQSRKPIDVIAKNRPVLILEDGRAGDAKKLTAVQPAVHPALFGHAQDCPQQGASSGCGGCVQPEAGQEDQGAWCGNQGFERDEPLSVPAPDRDLKCRAGCLGRYRGQDAERDQTCRPQAGTGAQPFRSVQGAGGL
jgi:type III restriction enzyme